MPQISVIVPVYKVEPYLRRCIDSILAQTFTDFELILVDDGSPDGCPAICDEYAERDGRIHVIHQANGGLSAARNAGIAQASGEWISFVDSDDFLQPEFLERLLIAAVSQDVKLSVCAFSLLNQHGEPLELNASNGIPDAVLSADEILERLQKPNGWFFVMACTKLFHRSLLVENFFPLGKTHEDQYTIAQLVWSAGRVACISDRLYNYIFMRKDGITGSKQLKNRLDYLEAIYNRCMFYREIRREGLIDHEREAYFRELKNCAKDLDHADSAMKKRLRTAKKQYSEIPGKGVRERLHWLLFRVHPVLDDFVIDFCGNLRR